MASRSSEPKSPSSLERYRVPILDKTLDLIELLAKHPDGLTVTDMTAVLKVPKNSVFRIATTLALRGYAERNESTKVYRLSRNLLSVGYAAVGGQRLIQAAGPVLVALRDETGETALLGTISGDHGVVLDQVPSSFPVKVVVEIGHAFPFHTAAPAKAILAFQTPELQEKAVQQIRFTRHTEKTLLTKEAYLQELDEARRLGFALDRGEESETYACAAAPVFNHRGEPVAALWISGPSDRVTLGRLPELAEVVKRHADQLSGKLGFHPPDSIRP